MGRCAGRRPEAGGIGVPMAVVVGIGRMRLRHSSLMEQHQTEGRQLEGMSSMHRWKRRAKVGSINGIRSEGAMN